MGKIKPGQWPSAKEWNRHVDASDAYHRFGRLGNGGGDSLRGIPGAGTEVRVRNGSGGAVDRFDVLGINGILIDATTNEEEFIGFPCFVGGTPDIDTHRGKWVLCMEPIAASGIGRAVVAGYAPAIVDIADTAHKYAEIEDSSTTLTSAREGHARILYQESGTGSKHCVLLIGARVSSLRVGKLGSTLAHNAIGTVTLWTQSGSSPFAASANTEQGINITGVTLQPNVFVKLTDVANANYPIIEPIELGSC